MFFTKKKRMQNKQRKNVNFFFREGGWGKNHKKY